MRDGAEAVYVLVGLNEYNIIVASCVTGMLQCGFTVQCRSINHAACTHTMHER